MARRTKEEAQETRSSILDTAERLFHDKGVARTTLCEIAQAAGVTRGAIYWHFKNKEDLFTAMLDRVRMPLEAMVEANADPAVDSPLVQLRATCTHAVREVATNEHCRLVFDILFHKCELVEELSPVLERNRGNHRAAIARLEKILINAINKGQLHSNTDPRRAAVAIHAYLVGLLSEWLADPQQFDLPGEAEALVDAIVDAVQYSKAFAVRRDQDRGCTREAESSLRQDL